VGAEPKRWPSAENRPVFSDVQGNALKTAIEQAAAIGYDGIEIAAIRNRPSGRDLSPGAGAKSRPWRAITIWPSWLIYTALGGNILSGEAQAAPRGSTRRTVPGDRRPDVVQDGSRHCRPA